jgi:hypothetical protein
MGGLETNDADWECFFVTANVLLRALDRPGRITIEHRRVLVNLLDRLFEHWNILSSAGKLQLTQAKTPFELSCLLPPFGVKEIPGSDDLEIVEWSAGGRDHWPGTVE